MQMGPVLVYSAIASRVGQGLTPARRFSRVPNVLNAARACFASFRKWIQRVRRFCTHVQFDLAFFAHNYSESRCGTTHPFEIVDPTDM